MGFFFFLCALCFFFTPLKWLFSFACFFLAPTLFIFPIGAHASCIGLGVRRDDSRLLDLLTCPKYITTPKVLQQTNKTRQLIEQRLSLFFFGQCLHDALMHGPPSSSSSISSSSFCLPAFFSHFMVRFTSCFFFGPLFKSTRAEAIVFEQIKSVKNTEREKKKQPKNWAGKRTRLDHAWLLSHGLHSRTPVPESRVFAGPRRVDAMQCTC